MFGPVPATADTAWPTPRTARGRGNLFGRHAHAPLHVLERERLDGLTRWTNRCPSTFSATN